MGPTTWMGVLLAVAVGASPGATPISADAKATLEKVAVRTGLCAVLAVPAGAKDGLPAFAVDLARGSDLLVYVQSPDEAEVAAVRRAAESAGLLGKRLFVDRGALSSIHLADNLADAVIAGPAVGAAKAEILRVLHPGGVALLGEERVVKPASEGLDHWTHPYHGPDNNPQSTDQLARAPYATQFLAGPMFGCQPAVTVAAGGRIFKAFGHMAFRQYQNHAINTLFAINAYNGAILWTRPLKEGFMIHRNTMVATPETLYLADDESCKLIDAATGEVKGEIVVPDGLADGRVWKWMALEGGVLYALVGGEEVKAPVARGSGTAIGGWPWGMWPGYDYRDPQTAWGFGRTVLAIDPATKTVLWNHREAAYLDSRGTCLRGGRLYTYSPERFLLCLDAKSGGEVWRRSDEDLLAAIGRSGRAQGYLLGFATSTYVKADDRFLFFAGPQRPNLAAVSAADGRLRWQRRDGNFQLVLRDDALYAAGQQGRTSFKLDYQTGEVLAQFINRRACTRATGSVDSVFFRAAEGTVRFVPATGAVEHIAPMRPPCHEGVIISNGLLYWGPWICGCHLSLFGHIALGPADRLSTQADPPETRLEPGPPTAKADVTHLLPPTLSLAGRGLGEGRTSSDASGPAPHPWPLLFVAASLPGGERDVAAPGAPHFVAGDWPTYRGDNRRSATTTVNIPGAVKRLWTYTPPAPVRPTAPVAAQGLVLLGGDDGIVRAINAADGAPRWQAATGAAINFPPAVSRGRLFVGSGDGWVYALTLAGERLWRFRAAPAERWIPVYGKLLSTWPVAGGVVAEDGVVYAAAGIAHYDGTHVYALDAATGAVKWHNGTSGSLSEVKNGVSLQGPLSLEEGRLCLPGGNVCPQATYDLETGRYLQAPPRGIQTPVRTLFYYEDPMVSVEMPALPAAVRPNRLISVHRGCVTGPNAVLLIGRAPGAGRPAYALCAVGVSDGAPLWTEPLPAPPVPWGLAVDRQGRIIVTLEDGRVLCFAAA